uniref:ubiquitinyl hydrolase 1 n=1 Tax=Oryzias sinensis TaxID=183150 RepID=A0A8C8DWM6_9TELE
MSGAHEQERKRRPSKTFLISADIRVHDAMEGSILLKRGSFCLEQDLAKSKTDQAWVKVVENDIVLKLEKKYLVELHQGLAGLLEPVVDLETRVNLMYEPNKLQQLASLPVNTPLWVNVGQHGELAEAELRYVGPLSRGSNAVYFGVELKGSAMGKGTTNGTHRGHRLFTCPDACGLFVPISHVHPRTWFRSNVLEAQARAQERNHHRSNGRAAPPQNRRSLHKARSAHPQHIIPGPAEPPSTLAQNQVQGPFQVGQRVSVHQDENVCAGEVRFCGALPGRSSSEFHVGVLLDAPVGNWDGTCRGEKLCHIPSKLYGLLLPASAISPEQNCHQKPPQPKPLMKQPLPPATKPASTTLPAVAPKVALLPPTKQGVKPPPLPPPKATQKVLPTPPVPPPKPPNLASDLEKLQPSNGVHSPPSPLTLSDDAESPKEDEEEELRSDLEVGSMVEVNDPPLYGVIRWIGRISGVPETVAGIELDQELSAGTDGSYLGERRFRCPANKGLFVKLRNCRRDSRFPAPETPVNQVERCNSIAFAEWGSKRVEEHTPPVDGDEARELYQGWKKGIQGHLNSCYLDATLFSLFSCCSSADWLLFWPSDPEEHRSSVQAQDQLRCEIVNPLRRNGYVCASKTMALRRMLEAASNDASFTSQEKDPEEFLNKLFQLLRVEPLLKIRSMSLDPQECHLYQLFPPTHPPSPSSPTSPVESPIPLSLPPSLRVASVQNLLETSFMHTGLKFVEAPSCLLLLMPRFGKDFKMFDAILPTLSLDITDLLDDTLRQCSICQSVADWECLQCYEDPDITPGHLKQYCHTCNTQVHSHRNRLSHSPVKIGIPEGSWSGPLICTRRKMSLFAVTCIETSHYVSFVKHGPHPTDWLFFDSMADREGGQNGFNIPQVKACPEVGRYLSLSEEELSRVDPASLRETVRRLLCDSYMCLYHSPELSLYR